MLLKFKFYICENPFVRNRLNLSPVHIWQVIQQADVGKPNQCTMCTLYSFFSFRPSAVGHIVQPRDCCIIEHIFVPTRSVERNFEKIRFPWVSNSKFVNFPQIFPCSNYKMCPIIPLLFPDSNGDSPVATIFPCSNYGGFFTTGECYCTMYTLCNGVFPPLGVPIWDPSL